MSRTALSATTLSAALTKTSGVVKLTSTSGLAVGDLIAIGNELCSVNAIPISGQAEVTRGAQGTAAKAYASGTAVRFGSAAQFTRLRGSNRIGLAGDAGTLPAYELPLGQEVADPSTGNVYVLGDCASSFLDGEWVLISATGGFTQLAAGDKGRIGVIVEAVSASDRYAYAMVVGSYTSALFSSDVTTAGQLGVATGHAGIFNSTNHIQIHRAICTAAPSTATSPAVGGAVGTVLLDRPWTDGVATFVS